MKDGITYREATAADMPGIGHVRHSVVENLLTVEQLLARGITSASVTASFQHRVRKVGSPCTSFGS
jgi:hypothetical protein